MGIMAMLIALELFTLWFANSTLSSVRAFINGEGLWSKGEKDAVNALHKYARTGKEADYQQFQQFMKVPLGDHKTRLELMTCPDINPSDGQRGYGMGLAHFAISVGGKEKVNALTERLRKDNFTIFSEPRTTGDGYYESVVLDPEGNYVEISA